MVFDNPEDAVTMKKVGLNVLGLVGVTLVLIVVAVLIG